MSRMLMPSENTNIQPDSKLRVPGGSKVTGHFQNQFNTQIEQYSNNLSFSVGVKLPTDLSSSDRDLFQDTTQCLYRRNSINKI